MKINEWLRGIFLSLIALNPMALAGPIPWPPGRINTQSILAQADLLCRGTVAELSGADVSFRNAKPVTALLNLERCYKGSLPTGQVRVTFAPPANPEVYAPSFFLRKGEYALFSLNGSAPEFSFASSIYGKIKISSLVKKDNADIGKAALEADLKAGLSDPDSSLVIANLELLMGMGEVHSTAEIKSIATSSDLEVRGTALLALMRLGDYSMLQDAVSFLSLDLSDSQQNLLQNPVRYEFERIKDPTILLVLHHNLNSPVFFVRSAMVKGMKSVQSPDSVAYLIRTLDDKEPEIRFDSVIALAFIEKKTGEEWATTVGPDYQKKEPAIIQRWKNWWNDEGRYKYSTPPDVAKKADKSEVSQ